MPNDTTPAPIGADAALAPLVLAAALKAAPAATNGCTRSHPHEAMSAECQVRAVIAEMRSKEARGAEATEHELGEMADRLTQALEAYTAQAAPPPAVQQGGDLQACAIGDSNYAAGMLLGWNLCTAGMDAEFSRIREDRIRAAVQASRAAHPAVPAAQGDAVDAAFEAVRQRLCGIQRYSFLLADDGGVRRVQDRTGNWIEFDAAHELFDPVAVDAARAQSKEGAKHGNPHD